MRRGIVNHSPDTPALAGEGRGGGSSKSDTDTKKRPAPKDRSFAIQIDQRRSEVPVRCGSRLVDGVLCRFLGVAQGLLALAFDFLNRALALQLVGTDGFADTLLGLADSFVGGAFNLVCRATRSISPSLD